MFASLILLHPCCLSPLHLPFLDLPLCLCVCFFGPPTQNTRFNSEGWWFFSLLLLLFLRLFLRLFFLWLITLGIFPAFEHPFLGGGGGDSDSSISPTVHAGESHANYPGYWLPRRTGCDLHEVTFSSNIQTFAPLLFFFSSFWQTINRAAFSAGASFAAAAPLPRSLAPFLRLLSSQKQGRIYCQNLCGVCAEVKLLVLFCFFFFCPPLPQ